MLVLAERGISLYPPQWRCGDLSSRFGPIFVGTCRKPHRTIEPPHEPSAHSGPICPISFRQTLWTEPRYDAQLPASGSMGLQHANNALFKNESGWRDDHPEGHEKKRRTALTCKKGSPNCIIMLQWAPSVWDYQKMTANSRGLALNISIVNTMLWNRF